jgi:hypothetical protein
VMESMRVVMPMAGIIILHLSSLAIIVAGMKPIRASLWMVSTSLKRLRYLKQNKSNENV